MKTPDILKKTGGKAADRLAAAGENGRAMAEVKQKMLGDGLVDRVIVDHQHPQWGAGWGGVGDGQRAPRFQEKIEAERTALALSACHA